VFRYGAFLNAVFTFLTVAAAIFFFVVKPLNALAARRKAHEEPEPEAPAEDILLLTQIRDLLAQGTTPSRPT
jgi:large conductance mechanosensitive channel